MKFLKSTIMPVLLATVWISLSEFIRNEFLVKSFWINHYEKLGLIFPSSGINGAFWGLWSLMYAVAIFILSKRFSLIQTVLISWFVGFAMMWIVIGNLGVLPYKMMYIAVPLSLVEAIVAALIIVLLTGTKREDKINKGTKY